MPSRAIAVSLLCAAAVCAQETILPVLEKNCLPCHNAKLHQAGLDLSTRESALRGSENGAVIVAGKPEDSRLYKLVAHTSEPGMPFKAPKLPDAAIARIAEWIK